MNTTLKRKFRMVIIAGLLATTLVSSGCNPRMFGAFARVAFAVAVVAVVLHHHDEHYHHHQCGHEYVIYEEEEVYNYQDRWEYYDHENGEWFYYEDRPY